MTSCPSRDEFERSRGRRVPPIGASGGTFSLPARSLPEGATTLTNGDELLALTVAPGIENSARLENVLEPDRADGVVLVRTVALGVCGTDREIISGEYGTAPPGQKRLILGHESLGRVETAPPGSGLIP